MTNIFCSATLAAVVGILQVCGAEQLVTVTAPPASDVDTTLFIEPFYRHYDPNNKTATAAFRKAYCDARHISYEEDYTLLFNTAVVQGPAPAIGAVYLTRESFKDSTSFLKHLKDVSNVFPRAGCRVADWLLNATMLGTQADLDALRADIEKFHAIDFVLDPRAFRKAALTRRQDYFALDYFLTLNDPSDLSKFQQVWGETRDFAYTFPGILSFGMGVHRSSDGKTVQMQLKETFEDVATYKAWLPKAEKYAKAFFDLANFSVYPNPFSMTSHPFELEQIDKHCKDVGCVQYALDNCSDVAFEDEVIIT